MIPNMSLLITGANGFVGKSLIDYLSKLPTEAKPVRIALVSRTGIDVETKKPLHGIEIFEYKCDLREPWTFDFKPTHIMNFAADGSENAYSKEAAVGFEKIVENLIKWCKSLDTPKVFHSSSGACFGYFPISSKKLAVVSDELLQKKRLFIESRKRSEGKLVEASAANILDLRMGRLFTFIGRHLLSKTQYALPSFLNQAIKTGIISISGNPHTIRSYLSDADMSEWIFKALTASTAVTELAIGSAIPVSIEELAQYIAGLTDSQVQISNPKDEGDVYVADNQRTLAQLDVSETILWKDSISNMILHSKASN